MKSALEKAAQLLAIIAAAVSGCAPPLLTTSPVPTPTFITQPASLTRDESVHTNQIGYQPNQFKQVVVSGELPIEATFNLVDEQGQVEFTGPLVAFGLDSDSRDQIARGDFSAFDAPGTYRASVDGHGASYPFVVAPDANADVLRLAMRWFYLQRSGVDLEDSVTGLHHRADHTTPAVLWDADGVHPERTFDVSGGWWDAGDFGRYVSPAATTLMSLFYAYRFNPDAFADGSLNIPESGNGVPDLLDEARWELEWLLKMQRADGAVHHKAATAHFTGWVLPEDDTQPIYVFGVSTQATGQFAGAMAEAGAVYRDVDSQFADQLLEAARRAWGWLGANPDQYPPGGFRNPGDIETGEYSAGADEVGFRLWAAASLLHATGEQTYADSFSELWPQRATWPDVYGLYWPDGYAFAMVAYLDSPKGDDAIKTEIRQVIAEQSKAILNVINSTGYSVALRGNSDEFGYTWGSHCVMLNYATYLLLANEVAPGQKLVDGAAAQLNWILGANSLNKAFITGAGGNPIRTLHHAMSVASGITFPGAIGEGPNAMSIGGDPVLQAMFDADVPFSRRYADGKESWATNEPTIYGNAAFVAVAAWFTR